jgi:hypothetical protein
MASPILVLPLPIVGDLEEVEAQEVLNKTSGLYLG